MTHVHTQSQLSTFPWGGGTTPPTTVLYLSLRLDETLQGMLLFVTQILRVVAVDKTETKTEALDSGSSQMGAKY